MPKRTIPPVPPKNDFMDKENDFDFFICSNPTPANNSSTKLFQTQSDLINLNKPQQCEDKENLDMNQFQQSHFPVTQGVKKPSKPFWAEPYTNNSGNKRNKAPSKNRRPLGEIKVASHYNQNKFQPKQ